jgi:hypothetical protein
MKTLKDALLRTDWVLFRQQKEWLNRQSGEEAAGLLNFLDAVQDAVVDDGVLPESVVFPEE